MAPCYKQALTSYCYGVSFVVFFPFYLLPWRLQQRSSGIFGIHLIRKPMSTSVLIGPDLQNLTSFLLLQQTWLFLCIDENGDREWVYWAVNFKQLQQLRMFCIWSPQCFEFIFLMRYRIFTFIFNYSLHNNLLSCWPVVGWAQLNGNFNYLCSKSLKLGQSSLFEYNQVELALIIHGGCVSPSRRVQCKCLNRNI